VELTSGLPGIELEVQPVRSYPYGPLAAHTLGYLRRDDHPAEEAFLARYNLPDYAGVVGIEGFYDPSLRGQRGVKSVLVNNLGYRQSETVWEQAEAGDNFHLTLDVEIQKAAEQALRSAGADVRGALVVMDVESGDLLALASWPSYDPNNFIPRISSRDWEALKDPRQLPLIHRATSGIYAPGSVFKIVIALAGLEAGIIDPDHVYHSPGYYELKDGARSRKIRDLAYEGRPASFDFKKAFIKSSNVYFVHYGRLTGLDDIVALGRRLHLGEKTDLPLPRGQEHTGIFPTPEWREHKRAGLWWEGDTANLAMGQGYIAVTPIQMAVMTAAVANGGRVLWPRLVDRVESQEPGHGPEVLQIQPPGRIRNHLGVSDRSLRIVRQAMIEDVENDEGTGVRARIAGYRIGGKTGTAQVQRPGGPMDHIAWFAAFGPGERPRYAVVVMIESGASGALTCTPLARQVFLKLKERESAPASGNAVAQVP
jgi:penicillin-binding protein 2